MRTTFRAPGKILASIATAAVTTIVAASGAAAAPASPMAPLPEPPGAPADQPFPPDYVVAGSQRDDPFNEGRSATYRGTLMAARETFQRSTPPQTGADAALSHFLNGKGRPFALSTADVDSLLKTDSTLFEIVEKTAESQARAAMMRARMERSLYGEQLAYRGAWQQPADTHRVLNWKNTLGHFSIAVTSIVVPHKSGGYTQKRKVYVYDIYDFSATNKYEGAGKAAATAGAWLNGQGAAHNFVTRGSSSAYQHFSS